MLGVAQEAILNEVELHASLKQLFPGERILTNVTKLHELKYTDSGKFLEFDVWLPKSDLCFEFQDEYHYRPTRGPSRSVAEIKRKDEMKKRIVLQRGISLVDIPCWWDGSLYSLGSTIQFQRPDLLVPQADKIPEIPLNPHPDFFLNMEIPNVGQLMLVQFVEDNKQFRAANDWWIGEKYDGVRCYWSNVDNAAYSRYGRNLNLPDKVVRQIPNTDIDAELWFGRSQFSLAVTLINRPDEIFLEFFRLLVFDIAFRALKELNFEFRYSHLLSAISSEHPHSILAFRMMCMNKTHLNEIVHEISTHDGEGLILQQSSSHYENGKSNSILKLKVTGSDREAKVVEVKSNGSLRLKLSNNSQFWVPRQDVRIPLPSVGDIVTFSYNKNTKGLPIKPIVLRVRKDLMQSVKPNVISWKHPWKRRGFFDSFAATKGIDSLNPAAWYSVSASDVVNYSQEYYRIVKYHGTRLSECLMQLYPDIGLQKSHFAKSKSYWKSFDNRKEVMLQFAKSRSFDPYIASNWYSLAYGDIASFPSARSMLQYYSNNYFSAVVDLFPDLNISTSQFTKTPKTQWENVINRRERFCALARSLEFDPLVPENWYPLSYKLLEHIKGPNSILKNYYSCNLATGLMDMFPDIGLVKAEFKKQPDWLTKKENQKWYLKSVASRYQFNPLRPDEWIEFLHKLSSKSQVKLSKRLKNIFAKYNSVEEAITIIFTNINES